MLCTSFMKGFDKKASLANTAVHGVELAGLGMLAAPSIQRLRGKPMHEHTAAKWDLAGLGTLAGPAAYHIGKAIRGK